MDNQTDPFLKYRPTLGAGEAIDTNQIVNSKRSVGGTGRARVAVLGGGISGCAAAAQLARGGAQVRLIERTPRLGGLHRSVEVADYVFDIGAFVFKEHHSIFSIFPDVREIFPVVDSHYGSVRTGGFLDDYPLSLHGAREQFGSAFVLRCLAETLAGKWVYRSRDSIPTWVKYYIGPSLYEESGLRRYIERLYLSPHTEIDLEFAEKRMKVLDDWVGFRTNLGKLGKQLLRRRSLKGVIGAGMPPTTRVRPEAGFSEVYSRIEKTLRSLGVEISCGASVQHVDRGEGSFELVGLPGNTRFDYLFSTIPLGAMARLIGLQKFVSPEYVDLYSLFYELDGPIDFPYNVLHNFTNHGQWKRMTIFSRHYGQRRGKHFFTVEGTSKVGADRESLLPGAVRDFEAWLGREAIFSRAPTFLDGMVSEYAYPVYRTDTARGVEQLKRQVESEGVILVGRQGSFNYISSSDAAEDAKEVTDAFLASVDGLSVSVETESLKSTG